MQINLAHSGPVDQNLLADCIAGKRSSQEVLYKYFAPKMFALCLRYASDYHQAEDILQEGFVKVFNHLDRFRGDGSFEGWMKRIFINTSIEHYRRSQSPNKQTAQLDEAVSQPTPSKALSLLAKEDLMRLVQQLPTGYRTVFNLYAIEGYSHKEIAEMLGISEGTSKSQLARARKQLQDMISALES